MLIKDSQLDLRFVIDRLVCDLPLTHSGEADVPLLKRQFLGLDIDGRRISFAENVFYEVKEVK